MFNEERDKIFEDLGWMIECESPFEIRNEETESFATGEAARIVEEYLISNYKDLLEEMD